MMMNMMTMMMMNMMTVMTTAHLAPTLASYSSSLMSLARPKSAIFTMLLSPTRTFLAARSLQARVSWAPARARGPVDVVLALQVGHARRHLRRHVDQLRQLEQLPLPLQVLQQAAELHQLRHDVDGLLQRAHRVQLRQVGEG